MTGVVNSRGDAMRVMGREAEAVVLLEILIGSHTEREGGNKSPTAELMHKKQSLKIK